MSTIDTLTTDELKVRFKARTIPLESDFADLIDVAECGRRAVGANPAQTPNLASGLVLDEEGQLVVQVAPSKGIMVDDSGIGLVLEQQFISGMIMMFSGTTIPAGWALCDGGTVNGVLTPNLVDRFILGGDLSTLNGKSTSIADGTGSSKTYRVTSDSIAPNITMNNANTTLTVSMMPNHYHDGGLRLDNYAYNWASEITEHGISGVGNKGCVSHVSTPTMNAATPRTSTAGGGAPHHHANTATQASHSHNVDIIPPYYILAFIMKL